MSNSKEMTVEELRNDIALHKEQMKEWSALVKTFGDRLAIMEKEEEILVFEKTRLQGEMEEKNQNLKHELSDSAKVDEEIQLAKEQIKNVVEKRVKMEAEANTLKSTIGNLIAVEEKLEIQAKAKKDGLAVEYQPLLSQLSAQEKLLGKEIIFLRQEAEQLKEMTENLRTSEEHTNNDVQILKQQLSDAETKIRELRYSWKKKQDDFEKTRVELANRKSSTEKTLRDSDLELRDKVFAVAEMNREVEKVDKELVESQRAIEATEKEAQGERAQIRSLQMALQDVESKRQVEVQKLAVLQQEVAEADKVFKETSKEMSRLTDKEQGEYMSYVDELERELGMLKSDTDQQMKKKPGKKVDPILQGLKEEVDEKMAEVEKLKREQIEEAESARHQHLRRLAHIEVTNASMSSDQRLFHLKDVYKREKTGADRRKADFDLQLSESSKTLEALKAEYGTFQALCTPEVMKLRDNLGDDEQFERKVTTLVKAAEIEAQMNETKLQVLTQKNDDMDKKLHYLEGEFEEMKGQIEDDKKRKAANSTGYSMRTLN